MKVNPMASSANFKGIYVNAHLDNPEKKYALDMVRKSYDGGFSYNMTRLADRNIDLVIMPNKENKKGGLTAAFVTGDGQKVFSVKGKNSVSCTAESMQGYYIGDKYIPSFVSRVDDFAGEILSGKAKTSARETKTLAAVKECRGVNAKYYI